MFVLETAKQPNLKIWRDGKIVAEFVAEERGSGEGTILVGVFRTNDEELVKHIQRNCTSSEIRFKRLSSGTLNTVSETNVKSKRSKPVTAKRTPKRL